MWYVISVDGIFLYIFRDYCLQTSQNPCSRGKVDSTWQYEIDFYFSLASLLLSALYCSLHVSLFKNAEIGSTMGTRQSLAVPRDQLSNPFL